MSKKRRCPIPPSLLSGLRKCRGATRIPALGAGCLLGLMLWAGPSRAADSPFHDLGIAPKIAYLAELPASWRTGIPDPARNIARALDLGFQKPSAYPLQEGASLLVGAGSPAELDRIIRQGTADVFCLHGYEVVQKKMKPLLLATRKKGWGTRFVILAASTPEIQTLQDLRNQVILVHRDDCGHLADYWLEATIATGTGVPPKSFARYQTVAHPREAVLPVFFGEAAACVISKSAYQAVLAENPVQIRAKLDLELAQSPPFPAQVVACRPDLPAEMQQSIQARALRLNWQHGDEAAGFTEAADEHFMPLRELMANPAPVPPPGLPGPGAVTLPFPPHQATSHDR